MEFIYKDYDTSIDKEYLEILNKPLLSCICKHVMGLSSEKAQRVFTESNRIGPSKSIWGMSQRLHLKPEINRISQISVIQTMIYKNRINPVRIIIDKSGTPWVDNLHTAIANILVHPDGMTLGNMSIYMVDTRTSPYTIVSFNDSVRLNRSDIKGILDSAEKRLLKISAELININYTLEEFLDDNAINRECFTLEDNYFNK